MTDGILEIKRWILGRHKELEDLAPDQELIDSRLIDSLSFVELLVLIQHVSGREVDQSELDIEDFRTLNAIGERYFAVTTVD